jgi:N-acetylmuramoyl-L-alanine amidase
MLRFIVFGLFVLGAFPAWADVELALGRNTPTRISEVYHRDNQVYLAVDDILPALKMSGYWDSVAHVYRFKTPLGRAIISPGSKYLRLGESFIPLSPSPRFIDGRLRVTQEFITVQLASLLEQPVYYRNLNPPTLRDAEENDTLDGLFAFLLRNRKVESARELRAIAIDPGHGGSDVGALGLNGSREKDVSLSIALQLRKKIKMEWGIPVHLSRDNDYLLTPQEHMKPAQQEDVNAFLILHAQSSFSPEPSGAVFFVRPQDEGEDTEQDGEASQSMQLANSLLEAFVEAQLPVAGIRQAPILPLGRGDLPTVLVEMGYLSHVDDHQRLTEEEGQKLFVSALYSGLEKFAIHLKQSED